MPIQKKKKVKDKKKNKINKVSGLFGKLIFFSYKKVKANVKYVSATRHLRIKAGFRAIFKYEKRGKKPT